MQLWFMYRWDMETIGTGHGIMIYEHGFNYFNFGSIPQKTTL